MRRQPSSEASMSSNAAHERPEEVLTRCRIRAEGIHSKAKGMHLRVATADTLWQGLRESVIGWEKSLTGQIFDLHQRIDARLHAWQADSATRHTEHERTRQERRSRRLKELEGEFDELVLRMEAVKHQLHNRTLFVRDEDCLNWLLDLAGTVNDLTEARRVLGERLQRMSVKFREHRRAGSASSVSGEEEESGTVERLTKNERNTIAYNVERVCESLAFVHQFPSVQTEVRTLMADVYRRLAVFNEHMDSTSVKSEESSVRTAVLRAISSTHVPEQLGVLRAAASPRCPVSPGSDSEEDSLVRSIRVPRAKGT